MRVSQKSFADVIRFTGLNLAEVIDFAIQHDLDVVIGEDGSPAMYDHNEFRDPETITGGEYIVAYNSGIYGTYETFQSASALKRAGWKIEL